MRWHVLSNIMGLYINSKMEEECDYYFKLILLGCQSVGKTAIVQRFCYDCYEEESLKTTLGFDFLTKVLRYQGKKIQLQIWDTAGQERFRSVTKMYYQDVNGVVLVYDLASKQSIEKLQFWLDDLEMNGSKSEKRILVGNKLDLVKKREIQPFEGKRMATERGMDWVECSAKTGEGVADIFNILIDRMIKEFHERKDLMLNGKDDDNILPWTDGKKNAKTKLNSIGHTEKNECC